MNKLKKIALENKEIYMNGFYINNNGLKVDIRKDTKYWFRKVIESY